MPPVCRTLVHACAVCFGRVRIWLAVVLSLAALTSCRSEQVTAAQCQRQFAEQRHALGAKGNPGRRDFTPRLAARWARVDAEFGRLAKSATPGDCPEKLATLTTQMKRIESVLRKLDNYDVARMIRASEADLRHAEKLRGGTPDYTLITTYRNLQDTGAAAQKSLAPYVAAVDAVDPAKYSALARAMVALYNAAASNTAFADFKDARDTIKNYQPPEK